MACKDNCNCGCNNNGSNPNGCNKGDFNINISVDPGGPVDPILAGFMESLAVYLGFKLNDSIAVIQDSDLSGIYKLTKYGLLDLQTGKFIYAMDLIKSLLLKDMIIPADKISDLFQQLFSLDGFGNVIQLKSTSSLIELVSKPFGILSNDSLNYRYIIEHLDVYKLRSNKEFWEAYSSAVQQLIAIYVKKQEEAEEQLSSQTISTHDISIVDSQPVLSTDTITNVQQSSQVPLVDSQHHTDQPTVIFTQSIDSKPAESEQIINTASIPVLSTSTVQHVTPHATPHATPPVTPSTTPTKSRKRRRRDLTEGGALDAVFA